MTLQSLLQNVDYQWLYGDLSRDIRGVTANSLQIAEGDVFVCYQGVAQDGHAYISDALEKGAAALVVEVEPELGFANGLPIVQVASGRRALALLATSFYGNPASKLRMAGITGTNGKTSTSYLAYNILKAADARPGLLGTIQYGYDNYWKEAAFTTPDSVQLQRILHEMAQAQVDSVVMEVTSHALIHERVAGMEFDLAVFTNLTQDHLDFHGDMQTYLNAKTQLFRQLRSTQSYAILNMDEDASEQIRSAISGATITYGLHSKADFAASDVQRTQSGLRFQVQSPDGSFPVELPLLGEYNVYNALAAIAMGSLWGCSQEAIQEGLLKTIVPGRFEMVQCGQDFIVAVDYAHTPDALENVLTEARKFTEERLICVFGCGGDRDRGKRPKMGGIATRLADYTVITSDNPRTEDPAAIIRDVLHGIDSGVFSEDYRVLPDRAEAIQHALEVAETGDIVIIAGKGHEDYQIIGESRNHFDDREVAARVLGATLAC